MLTVALNGLCVAENKRSKVNVGNLPVSSDDWDDDDDDDDTDDGASYTANLLGLGKPCCNSSTSCIPSV